jgi:hypothetical protein
MQVDRKRSSYLKNKKREKARRAAEEARPSAASSSARPLSAPAAGHGERDDPAAPSTRLTPAVEPAASQVARAGQGFRPAGWPLRRSDDQAQGPRLHGCAQSLAAALPERPSAGDTSVVRVILRGRSGDVSPSPPSSDRCRGTNSESRSSGSDRLGHPQVTCAVPASSHLRGLHGRRLFRRRDAGRPAFCSTANCRPRAARFAHLATPCGAAVPFGRTTVPCACRDASQAMQSVARCCTLFVISVPPRLAAAGPRAGPRSRRAVLDLRTGLDQHVDGAAH